MRTTPTLVLLLFAFASQAQSPYRPFPESGAGWVEQHGWQDHIEGALNYVMCTRSVTFGSDTLVQGTPYHRLLIQGTCDVVQVFPAEQFLYSYAEAQQDLLYFRQDVAQRKLYAWKNNAEVLFFDFTLPVGPYPSTLLTPFSSLNVAALDSIELNDGWHRTWQLAPAQGGLVFTSIIEGVGTGQGFEPYVGTLAPPFEWHDGLVCHSIAGNAILPLGANVCDLVTSIPQGPGNTALSAYPNPSTNVIRFTGNLPAGTRYTAIDVTGALVGSGTLQHAQLDCAAWPVGLYAILLSDANGGELGTLRVFKE